MIDTHCHLTDPRLAEQLEEVLARARAAGVKGIVTVATGPEDWVAALSLAKDRPNLRCAIGVHPNYCHEVEFDQVELLRELHKNPRVVALGEMGLDYHYEHAPRERQAKFFESQLQLAQELKRPVIIHCREAVDGCLGILESFKTIEALFHCFTGTEQEAQKILDAGYLLGFTGVVTFKNADALRRVSARMPADRLLVETDAPYLSPEPMRKQKINEPALVMHTAAAVAMGRGISLAQLDELSTANAKRFYRWE